MTSSSRPCCSHVPPNNVFASRHARSRALLQSESCCHTCYAPRASSLQASGAFSKFLAEAADFYRALVLRLQTTYGSVGVDTAPEDVHVLDRTASISAKDAGNVDCRSSVCRSLVCLGDIARSHTCWQGGGRWEGGRQSACTQAESNSQLPCNFLLSRGWQGCAGGVGEVKRRGQGSKGREEDPFVSRLLFEILPDRIFLNQFIPRWREEKKGNKAAWGEGTAACTCFRGYKLSS